MIQSLFLEMFKNFCFKIPFSRGKLVSFIGQKQPLKVCMKRLHEEDENSEVNETKISKTTKSVKIINWNVNGFNALLKVFFKKINFQKNSGENIKSLISNEKPHALCLQEIKLNNDDKKYTQLLTGYTPHFNYCKAKKGYSGTWFVLEKIH
jgi:hypothetical protein